MTTKQVITDIPVDTQVGILATQGDSQPLHDVTLKQEFNTTIEITSTKPEEEQVKSNVLPCKIEPSPVHLHAPSITPQVLNHSTNDDQMILSIDANKQISTPEYFKQQVMPLMMTVLDIPVNSADHLQETLHQLSLKYMAKHSSFIISRVHTIKEQQVQEQQQTREQQTKDSSTPDNIESVDNKASNHGHSSRYSSRYSSYSRG